MTVRASASIGIAGPSCLLLLAVTLVGCSAAGAPEAPRASLPASAVQTIATRLRIPWGVAFLPDGTALVTERGNEVRPSRGGPSEHGTPRILSVTPAGAVREVQRLPEVNTRPGEGGLLGIAVSPRYATDRWVYIYYTTDSDNRVARLHLGQPPQPILTGIPITTDPGGNQYHEGGRLAFGPDGMLYVSTGETYYTRDIAQDRASLGGKILRVTPEGRPAPGNPFGDSPVYSLGHRNVQGMAWDSRGRMYASEFGEDRFDEVNAIVPGHNYGWPIVEGVAHDRRFTDPIATWPVAQASPSGIAVLHDRVYIACLHGQRLYRMDLDGSHIESLLAGAYGRLRTVIVAPDSTLWITTSNRDGRANGTDGPAAPAPEDDRILRLSAT